MERAHDQQILGNQASAHIHGDNEHNGKKLLEDKVSPAQDISQHGRGNHAYHGSHHGLGNGEQ